MLLSACIWESPAAIFGLVISASVNLFAYMHAKTKYEIYLCSLAEFKKVYDFAKWMNSKNDLKNKFVPEEIKESLQSLKNMSRIIIGMNGRRQNAMTGEVMAMVLEYMFGIMLFDVSMFNHIMKVIMNKQKDVLNIVNFVGEIDMEISVASYRKSAKVWSRPEMALDDSIKAEGLVHPLLDEPVGNDFILNKKAIITGPNAAGKSTFMKALAINCIMAQSINTVTAVSMKIVKLKVCTCMSLRDDILTGESYYFREAKYMKRMLDLIKNDKKEYNENILLVIDEILKGTNTKERVAASKAILDYIGKSNCFALVATHDNELTENEKYEDYYFSSNINEYDIVFDYKIHKGVCQQTNAIALLKYLDYPIEIVRNAKVNLCE